MSRSTSVRREAQEQRVGEIPVPEFHAHRVEDRNQGLRGRGTTGVDDPPAGDDADRNVVLGTAADFTSPNNLIALDPYFEGWQAPGQWMLDPYGRIHRVVQGRRNKRQGPVRLARPVPTQSPAASHERQRTL